MHAPVCRCDNLKDLQAQARSWTVPFTGDTLLLPGEVALLSPLRVLWLRWEPQQLLVERRVPNAVLRQRGARERKVVSRYATQDTAEGTKHHCSHHSGNKQKKMITSHTPVYVQDVGKTKIQDMPKRKKMTVFYSFSRATSAIFQCPRDRNEISIRSCRYFYNICQVMQLQVVYCMCSEEARPR